MNANSYKQLEERDLWIAELLQKNAALQSEVDFLKNAADDLNEEANNWEQTATKLQVKCNELNVRLAASQAREQQLLKRVASTTALLEAVCAVNPDSVCAKYELGENQKTINCPSDKTELETLISKAGEVMREKCVYAAVNQLWETEDSIRSIPTITLKDLK